jgi:hypothetical protein
LKFCKEKGFSFEQTCFGTSTTWHSLKVVKSKSKVVESKWHLINETQTFYQKLNTQKRKSPNKPIITIAMETLKKIKSNHKTIMVPWWVERKNKYNKYNKKKFMDRHKHLRNKTI